MMIAGALRVAGFWSERRAGWFAVFAANKATFTKCADEPKQLANAQG